MLILAPNLNPAPSASIEVPSKVINLYRKATSFTDSVNGKYADVIKYIDSQSEDVEYDNHGDKIIVSCDEGAQLKLKIAYGDDKSFEISDGGDRVRITYVEGNLKKENELDIEIDINNIKNIKDPAYMHSRKFGKYISPTAGYEEESNYCETVEEQQKFLNNKEIIPGGKSVSETIEGQFALLEAVLDGIRREKNEKFSTADKELLDTLRNTALEEVLQDFFTKDKVLVEDQDIIRKALMNEQITMHENNICYVDPYNREPQDPRYVFLGNVLRYDSSYTEKIRKIRDVLHPEENIKSYRK